MYSAGTTDTTAGPNAPSGAGPRSRDQWESCEDTGGYEQPKTRTGEGEKKKKKKAKRKKIKHPDRNIEKRPSASGARGCETGGADLHICPDIQV